MTNSIGFLLLLGTLLLLLGLAIFFVVREQIQKDRNSLEPERPARVVNKSALTSLILGIISFPPSLCFASILIDAMMQGGGSDSPVLLVLLCMAPFGLASAAIGVRALRSLSRNKMVERGKGFAIAGIILGLPGSILVLYYVFGFLFSRLNP